MRVLPAAALKEGPFSMGLPPTDAFLTCRTAGIRMAVATTERPEWHREDHTVKTTLVVMPPIPYYQRRLFLAFCGT